MKRRQSTQSDCWAGDRGFNLIFFSFVGNLVAAVFRQIKLSDTRFSCDFLILSWQQ